MFELRETFATISFRKMINLSARIPGFNALSLCHSSEGMDLSIPAKLCLRDSVLSTAPTTSAA
jgi:hypothetical protein